MSPRGFGSVFSSTRSFGRSRKTTPARRRPAAARRMPLAAEPLESLAMLATTATLSGDISPFTRIPVTFLRPDGSVGFSNTAYVGQLSWSGMSGAAAGLGVPAAFRSFCIEGLQSVSPGVNTYGNVTPLETSGLLGANRARLLGNFWRQYGPATASGFTDNTDSAAFQLAVWEIINDAQPAGPAGNKLACDLAAGQFSVNPAGRSLPAALRAAQWLAAFDTLAPATKSVTLYALENPSRQDQVVCIPGGVDLDVDSDNSGSIARSIFEDSIEDDPTRPGVIVPVGGGQVPLVVDVPAGRTATLTFDAAAALKVRVSPAAGMQVLPNGTRVIPVAGGSPQTFSIEAFAPSTSLADIIFTLTTTGTGPASSDTVRATAVAVDLDVDSDNDGRIDPDNGPGGTDDPIEADVSRGLMIPVYAGDSDRDGVEDTVDFNGIAGRSFMPLTLSINYGAASAWRQPIRSPNAPNEDLPGLAFTFTFSDAGLGPNAAGRFRIWTKDAQFARTTQDLVTSGTAISAWDLFRAAPPAPNQDIFQTHGIFTLYLEAVSSSDVFEPITVSMGGTGAWARAVTKDLVHVRGLEAALDLAVDSNNDEGFAVPAQRSAWEERLESHPYAIGKLVMQSSPDLDDYVAEDRLAAHFTPVVIELPRNLPLESRGIAQTIGVRFTMDAIGAMDSGKIQLWTRDKGQGLLLQDAAGEPSPLGGWRVFGHRVDFGKPYTLSQINYDPTTGIAILYMDGHVATRNSKLIAAEQGSLDRGDLEASLTFNAPNARISLAEDSVQYMVVRDDFFYHDLQFGSVGLGSTGSQVRSALASRGVYSYADLPNFALKRLTTRKDPDSPPGELQEILRLDPNSETAALLYNDADTPGTPTAYPGFKAVLYQDYAAVADNTFVLAFGGTDDSLGEILTLNPPDWVENICQGLGWRIAQYRWAMDVARTVEFATRAVPGRATLTTTGHSLGGGLASAASVVTGAPGVTFNAAGLHENSLQLYFENDPAELAVALARYQKPNELVTAFWVDRDFLSTFQDRFRLFVNPALGEHQKLDGPYDFAALTIQAIDAVFDSAALAPVVGTLVKLGVDLAAKAGTGYLMVRAHSMDAVLYGMLVEEHLVAAHRDLLGYPTSRFL